MQQLSSHMSLQNYFYFIKQQVGITMIDRQNSPIMLSSSHFAVWSERASDPFGPSPLLSWTIAVADKNCAGNKREWFPKRQMEIWHIF